MNRRPSRSHAVTTFSVQVPLTWSFFLRMQSHEWTGGHHFQCSSAADVINLSEKAIIWMNKRPSRSHAVTTFNVQMPVAWSLFLRKQSYGWIGGPVARMRSPLSNATDVIILSKKQSYGWIGGPVARMRSPLSMFKCHWRDHYLQERNHTIELEVTTFNVQVLLTWLFFLRKQSYGWIRGPVARMRSPLSTFKCHWRDHYFWESNHTDEQEAQSLACGVLFQCSRESRVTILA